MFDFYLNFRGKIAVKIGSRFKIGNKPDLTVKLFIKEFKVPIRLCFTPFPLGKSYASLLDKPKLTIDYNVKVGKLELTKIPFVLIMAITVHLVHQDLRRHQATEEVPVAQKDDPQPSSHLQVSPIAGSIAEEAVLGGTRKNAQKE